MSPDYDIFSILFWRKKEKKRLMKLILRTSTSCTQLWENIWGGSIFSLIKVCVCVFGGGGGRGGVQGTVYRTIFRKAGQSM